MKTRAVKNHSYISRIKEILQSARRQSLQAVNSAMVAAYWYVGREIVEEEQRGKKRAEYGSRMIRELSDQLMKEFGKGFSVSNLKVIRQFYLVYADRGSSIGQSLIGQSTSDQRRNAQAVDITNIKAIGQSLPGQSNDSLPSFVLSWTHYTLLVRVTRSEARNFYEMECFRSSWSVRELERQIGSLLFDRLAKSKDKQGLLNLVNKGHEIFHPEDLIKDPYVLEFTGLPEPPHFTESQLEQALITRLQSFLLELGKDIMFVARQKRITIDGDHYYIDLVFYHRELKCFLLIDLKTGKLTQQDVGQMLLYTGFYKIEINREDENPPIGLILCTDKNEAAVQYTMSDINRKIFTSKYQMHLPTVEELTDELKRERAALEGRLVIDGEKGMRRIKS
jgi:predicted nuclease of restriction endonuclease-like (RecB) superfamily